MSGTITDYDWAQGIALMTIFVMFFIELLAARFDVFGQHEHDLESSNPSPDLIRQGEKYDAAATTAAVPKGKCIHFAP